MKIIISLFLVIALLCGLTGSVFSVATFSEDSGISESKVISTATLDDDFADDSVIITLTNEASLAMKEYSASDFPAIRCKAVMNLSTETQKIAKAKLAVRGEAAAQNRSEDIDLSLASKAMDIETYHQVLCLELEEKGKENVLEAIKTLQEHDDVLCAEPNYYLTLCTTTPNDPYYADQYARSVIHLPTAWDISTGTAPNASRIVIGVIDTGIDESHPDLCDIVDYTISRDFSILQGNGDYTIEEVKDANGHGTHVAGIIAAAGNNAVGVCGVIWNARLASLKVADAIEGVDVNSVVLALEYAIVTGIPIVNFSMGYEDDIYSLRTKVYDYCNGGGLFVCSAGNAPVDEEGNNNDIIPHYPSNYEYPNIIAVGAINSTNSPCDFSHYGPTTVDIFAPGFHVLSCYSTDRCRGNCGDDSETGNLCYVPDNTSGYQGGYHYLSGTSMAAPFVTGVAALIKAEYPNLTALQIKERIMTNVRPVSALSGMCVSGGKLDAYWALHNHSYSYSQYNSTTHTKSCSCGKTIQQNHSCTYTQISNTTHTASCACGYSVTESHNFMPSGSGYLCFDCSYYTPFIQVGSLIVDPETE